MSSIEIREGIVTKTFTDEREAAHTAKLYNSFPDHVRASQAGSSITYPYVEGITLDQALEENDRRSATALRRLGRVLHHVHSADFEYVPSYDQVCAERGHYPEPEAFIRSIGYLGIIHGDLNTKNLIVADSNNLVIIDRLCEKGDTLFDFTFVMSILAKYLIDHDVARKDMLYEFFDSYLDGNKDKDTDNFFVSFRNNFLNYGYFVQADSEHRASFPEWEKGKEIADGLSVHSTFMTYLDSL